MSFKQITRRDAIRLASALGAAKLSHAPLWLSGCAARPSGPAAGSVGQDAGEAIVPIGSGPGPQDEHVLAPAAVSGSGGADAARSGVDAGRSGGTVERAAGAADDDAGQPSVQWSSTTSWWMQNEYAPVAEERDSNMLEVIGAIPPELDGIYLRNGPNPKFGDRGHWFLGHGMVHGVRLSGGKALWYRNRYVRSPLLDRPPQADGDLFATIPDIHAPTSNVSLVSHASRLLALAEQGLPFELSKHDLSTIGEYDFGAKLTTSFTAHPKIDPISGEMMAFAYHFDPTFLRYYRIDRSGALVQSEDIDLPLRPDGLGSKATMMHDFQVTGSKVVFMHLPIVLDVAALLSGNKLPLLWDGSNGAHLGIMPREGRSADVVWIDIDPCFIFHTFNAYDDARGNVVLDVSRSDPPLWEGDNTGFSPDGRVHRYTIDLAARKVTLEQLDDRQIGFPQVDRRVVTQKHRYGYAVQYLNSGSKFVERVPAILKYDLERQSSVAHELEPALRADEAFFVPAANAAAEDEGYLMTYVYDRRSDSSLVMILDATHLSGPPIAQVRLPFRVPVGFHSLWVPS